MAINIADLFVSIGANLSEVDKAFAQLQQRTKAVADKMAEVGTSISDGFTKAGGHLRGFGKDLSLYVSAPLVLAGGAAIRMAGQIEQAELAFTTMLGSAQRAGAFLRELERFAAKTPFEFVELQGAAKRMMALGFQAEQVIPALTAIGDAVAGLGGGSEVIDHITLALGQMQAKGRVSAQEMKQLAEAGIPAWKILADAIGVSIPQAMKAAEAGAIESAQVVPAILAGMGARFHGLMEDQSKTLLGQWSNLKDQIDFLLRDIGRSIITTFNLTGVLGQLQAFVAGFREAWGSLDTDVRSRILAITAVLAALGPAFIIVGTAAKLAGTTIAASVAGWKALSIVVGALSLPMLGLAAAALAAAAAIAAASLVIIANWKLLKAEGERALSFLTDLLYTFGLTLGLTSDQIDKFGGSVKQFLGIVGAIEEQKGTIAERLAGATAGAITEALSTIFGQTWTDIKQGFGDVTEWAKGQFRELGQSATTATQDVAGAIQSQAGATTGIVIAMSEEARRLERELTAELVPESQRRMAQIERELADRVAQIRTMGLSATDTERLVTLATSIATQKRTELTQEMARSIEKVERELTANALPESQRRMAQIERELADRMESIKAMGLIATDTERLIGLAQAAAAQQRTEAYNDLARQSRELEQTLTVETLTGQEQRLAAVSFEAQGRIRQIREMGLSVAEQERLITLAVQAEAVKREEIIGSWMGFWRQQLSDLANSNVFTLSTITSSFASATASWIQGISDFGEFWKNTVNTMLTAAVNFIIQWLARLALGQLQAQAINEAILISHTATEEAKTAITIANESVRMIAMAATNKAILAAAIATLTAFGAVGRAAMATMGAVVTAATGVLAAIGAALAASIVGSPLAPAYFAAAALVGTAGAAAVTAGFATIEVALGAAIAAAAAAVAVPLAAGGLVTGPTFALLGEAKAGPEAVIPLDRMRDLRGESRITLEVFLDSHSLTKAIMPNVPGYVRIRTGLARA